MTIGDLEFKSEDFKDVFPDGIGRASLASLANHLLRARLERAKQLFSHQSETRKGAWATARQFLHTHTARLVCIEEISK